MLPNTILTIGHGPRVFPSFLSLLKKYNVSTLIDIRSNPFSRFHPSYNRKTLEQLLGEESVRYLFKGDLLGGKPKNENYYENGSISYRLIQMGESYKTAIDDLVESSRLQTICLLCAELKPATCHRKLLVGQSLIEKGIRVLHIDETGDLEEHTSTVLQPLF